MEQVEVKEFVNVGNSDGYLSGAYLGIQELDGVKFVAVAAIQNDGDTIESLKSYVPLQHVQYLQFLDESEFDKHVEEIREKHRRGGDNPLARLFG